MINELLNQYKNISETIIINLKNDINIDELMKKRVKIIEKIIRVAKEDNCYIRELYKTMELIELDIRLKGVLEEEITKVKKDIRILHKGKQANNAYNKSRNLNNIFNIKI